MTDDSNTQFELSGLHHVALVCKDMQRTVDFYTDVLGMKLIKTIELPAGVGQHFFFDMGGGQALAFFWFPEAPDRAPGVASPKHNITPDLFGGSAADWVTAHGSMNHIAFMVSPDRIEEYHHRLTEKGLDVSSLVHHDTSDSQITDDVDDERVFVSSLYFTDPDGIVLEFACWQRELSAELGDRADHKPATPADLDRYRAQAQVAAQAAE